MSGLLRRIQALEGNAPPADRVDGEPEWARTVKAMSEQDVDHLLRSLLIVAGEPVVAATREIWRTAVEGGVDGLSDEQFEALYAWIAEH